MTRTSNWERGELSGAAVLIAGGLASGLCGAAIADVTAPADISDTLRDAIDPAPQSDVDLLLTDWGQGSVYDLDCDGIVDTGDFLLLLEQVASGAVSSRALTPMLAEWGLGSPWDLNCDGTVDVEDMLALLAQDNAAPYANLLEAWGSDTHNDLNCDGTVGVVDMLLLLERMAGGTVSPASLNDLLAHWGQDTRPDRNCDGNVGIEDFLILINAVADL